MEIREIGADERASVSLPVETYAFYASPASGPVRDVLERNQRFLEDDRTLVAEEDSVPLASATGIPMRQNVRGSVYPMAGVANVATLPQARRRGYARALVTGLLDRMRDSGHAVSTLYPFRPSFYERLGFTGLPATRTVTFPLEALAGLLRADLPGEVTLTSAADGYAAYQALSERVLSQRHGFAVLPGARAVRLRDSGDRWIAVARAGGEPVAALAYRISGYGGVLTAADLLAVSPLGRALLLQFLARHIGQVTQAEIWVSPDELPELWATDLAAVTRAEISFPGAPAPMARVLSLPSLAGLRAGPQAVTVEVAGDRYLAGRYLLDGRSGALEVTGAGAGPAEATLTAAGLSALVYGVLDPEDVAVRGLGDLGADPAAKLRTLFPRQVPYLSARF